MAIELMPILKSIGPLVSVAERIVSSWMAVRSTARERDLSARLEALERHFTDQAKLAAELAEQVQRLAQALEKQVSANESLERAVRASRRTTAAALGLAAVALVAALGTAA
ncbi:hypothetical protein [Pelomicrobium sp.]|jgi:uncharacterized coiled-coil protein SlyX|uniref:hypothetical protein n=1 Tax=Pelomicrobium sp. TaxID=2815319 RepID=UPI002FDDED27